MKVLQSIVRWFKAKDAAAAEAIECEHEVAFAKQDLENMQRDLAQVTNSVGEIKATLAGLKRELLAKERTIANLEEDAKALLDRGKEKLAMKLCADIETVEAEVEVFRNSIQQQENMLQTLGAKRRQLQDAVYQAESSLRMMETMDSVARASEKISTVRVGDSSSALSRFQNRQKRLQQRLDKAKAINELKDEDRGQSLKNEVDSALGRSKGSKVLARLQQKKN